MRAMGPGSVASLLKIALDVAYWLLWVFAAAGLLGAAFVLVMMTGLFGRVDLVLTLRDGATEIPLFSFSVAFGFLAWAAYFVGFVFILHRVRRIFRTLAARDPFRPENTRHLRQIAWALGVVTGVQFASRAVGAMLAPGVIEPQGVTDLMTPVFSLLVIFVLAEVFREGARLRRDAELTI